MTFLFFFFEKKRCKFSAKCDLKNIKDTFSPEKLTKKKKKKMLRKFFGEFSFFWNFDIENPWRHYLSRVIMLPESRRNFSDMNLLNGDNQPTLIRVHAPREDLGVFRRSSKAGYKNWRRMSAWSVGSRASYKFEER